MQHSHIHINEVVYHLHASNSNLTDEDMFVPLYVSAAQLGHAGVGMVKYRDSQENHHAGLSFKRLQT